MGRQSKYSKEVKIKACKDYDEGMESFNSIAVGMNYKRSSTKMVSSI